MNCEIKNLTRRLVSIHCNSGKTCHLPPGYRHELPEQEISDNPIIKKLQNRKLIAIRQLSEKSTPLTKSDKESGTVGEAAATEAGRTTKKKTQTSK